MAEVESNVQVSKPVPLPPPTPTNPNPGAIQKAAPVAITQPAPAQIMRDNIDLTFTVRTFKQDGSSESITIPLPSSPDFQQWSFAQQVGMLKNGVWEKESLQSIIFGLAYAKHIGAEVLEGELFPTGNGRWGTSNKYKIKKGFATGKILGYTTEMEELNIDLPDSIAAKCIQKKELLCTVTLDVKGLTKPIIRKAKLSRWFTASNPNWGSRPEHMLELNTLAHAMEFLVPGETDESPLPVGEGMGSPVQPVPSVSELKALRAAAAPKQTLEVRGLPDPTEISSLLDSLPALDNGSEQGVTEAGRIIG